MSADAWVVCPECLKKIESRNAERVKKAEDSYGKVTPEEYLKLYELANQPIEAKRTLREDYELDVLDDGSFYISFKASCYDCSYSFKFKLVMSAEEMKRINYQYLNTHFVAD